MALVSSLTIFLYRLQDYLRLSRVDFEIYFFQLVPIIDNMVVHDLSLEASIEEFANEIVVWLLVEFDRLHIVHQIDYFQRHLMTKHLRGYPLLQFLSIDVVLPSLGLNIFIFTSDCLIQGNLPIRR